MAAPDNSHAQRLRESLRRHIGMEEAEAFMDRHPLSVSADFKKKAVWARETCAELEETLARDQVKAIRMDCACGPSPAQIKALQKIYRESGGPEEFARAATALKKGYTLSYQDGALLLCYPTCYCSCVKRDDGPMPQSWCDCTLGYAKRMFSGAMGKPVAAELLQSVKTGGQQCVIRITW